MMNSEGQLSPAAIQAVLQTLEEKNPASTWLISDGQDERVIYFSTGGIRLYSSDGRKVRSLEDHLTRQGLCSKDQLAMALEASRENRREGLDDVLERTGAVKREVFRQATLELIYQELCDLFLWENAIYEFYEGNPPPEIFDQEHPALFVSVDIKSLVNRLKEWSHEWSLLKAKLYSERIRLQLLLDAEQFCAGKELSPPLRQAVRSMDGKRSLHDLIRTAGCDIPDLARMAHDGLKQSVIKGALVAEKTATTAGEVMEEVEKLEEALDRAINTILIHKRIATNYEKLDEKDQASEHYQAMGDIHAQGGRIALAMESYQRAIKTSPQNFKAHETLIRRLQDQEQNDKALDEIYALTKKFVTFGFLERAYDRIHGIISKVTNRFDIRMFFGDLLVRLGRNPEAVNHYLSMARDKKKLGQLEGLEEVYTKVLALDPANGEARSGFSLRRQERAGRGLVYAHRISAAAAALLIVAWSGTELLARAEWRKSEQPIREMLATGKLSEGFERLRAIGKAYPGSLHAKTIVSVEERLFREAFEKLQGDLESGIELLNEGKYLQAGQLLNSVATNTIISTQKEQARRFQREAEAAASRLGEEKRRAKRLLEAHLYEDAFQVARKILDQYPQDMKGLEFPFLIQSNPSSAEVSVNGTFWGYTPLWVSVSAGGAQELKVQKRGYSPQIITNLTARRASAVQVNLLREKRGL